MPLHQEDFYLNFFLYSFLLRYLLYFSKDHNQCYQNA